jgi:hypothetical protein
MIIVSTILALSIGTALAENKPADKGDGKGQEKQAANKSTTAKGPRRRCKRRQWPGLQGIGRVMGQLVVELQARPQRSKGEDVINAKIDELELMAGWSEVDPEVGFEFCLAVAHSDYHFVNRICV